MTRGQMACATLALLIWSLLACAPLPEGLLTPTATLKAPPAVVSTATPINTSVPTATPTHLGHRPERGREAILDHVNVPLIPPWSDSREFHFGTAILLGDPTLELRP